MSSHSNILIHLVFSTKYRKRLLNEKWMEELFSYIGGTIKEHKAVLLKAGGVEDHVHLLIRFHPQFAIASTIRLLKANSSRWINEANKMKVRFSWQSGYGAFTVSQSNIDKVHQYIGNQREHHRQISFRDEYFELLKRHRIAFDEEFVFETEHSG